MEHNVKYNLRKNTFRIGKNYAYIPKYLIPDGTTHIEIYLDKDNKAIQIVPAEEGYKLTERNAYMFSSKALAKVMPLGNYLLEKDLIFKFLSIDQVSKEEE